MTRKALGRGLNALLGEVDAPTTVHGLDQVPVNLFDPNPFQPRQTFPEDTLKELAESIRASGVVQPVLARRAGSRYQLIAGERRWRAASLAGLETIPALIRELTDAETLEIALTENLLRENLNPLEVARAYEQLQKQFQLTHEEIAQRLGTSRPAITNALRLLDLDQEIQTLLIEGKLTAGHARALAGIDSPEETRRLARTVLHRGLSVRQLEAMISSGLPDENLAKRPGTAKKQDPNIRSAVVEMERALGTRVAISGDGKRGKIEITYYSMEDLNRIYDFILRK